MSEDTTSTETTTGREPSGGNGVLALDAQHVTKQFGGLTAVSDVTFSVPEKSIV